MSLQTFTSLANVPVHYDRYKPESGLGYGTRGKPFKPQATQSTIGKLQSCFADIFAQSPFGPGEVITSAGAYVAKPGYHGAGQAFDLDGIFWAKHDLVALDYPKKPHLYLAIESIVRQYFGTVLGYNYNEAHKDHVHMDVGSGIGFQKMSKSRVEYLQSSLFYVHGYHVGIDGVWGPATERVVKDALKDLAIGGSIFSKDIWLSYLKATTLRAFHLANS